MYGVVPILSYKCVSTYIITFLFVVVIDRLSYLLTPSSNKCTFRFKICPKKVYIYTINVVN
jgi:hypothetical protein